MVCLIERVGEAMEPPGRVRSIKTVTSGFQTARSVKCNTQCAIKTSR